MSKINTNEETSNILDENSSTEETPQDNADTPSF